VWIEKTVRTDVVREIYKYITTIQAICAVNLATRQVVCRPLETVPRRSCCV